MFILHSVIPTLEAITARITYEFGREVGLVNGLANGLVNGLANGLANGLVRSGGYPVDDGKADSKPK